MPAPAPHLYWRINCQTNAGSNQYFQIAEVAMAAAPGGANLCAGGTASANGSASGDPPASALDNNLATFWCSAGGTPAWWYYEFPSAVEIVEVTLSATSGNPQNAPLGFTLDYSDDNSTWTTRGSFTASSWSAGQAQVFDVPSDALVSQVVTEALGTKPANIHASQVVTEALGFIPSKLRVSQLVVEVLGFTPPSAIGAPVQGALAASGKLTTSQIATFTVTLSAPSAETCTVAYATANGTATSPTDFVGTSGTLTFAPGAVSQDIVVVILADTAANADKSFSMVLSGPVNCLLPGPPWGVCQISSLRVG